MKLTQTITVLILGFLISSFVSAHEGMHAAGQVHAGEHHMGLLELALAVIATVCFVAYQLKKYKSKK